jgi:hypothetical protein
MGDSSKCINIKIVSGIVHNSYMDKLVAGCESTDYMFGSGESIYLAFCGDLRISVKLE